jgi:hypothetical protein
LDRSFADTAWVFRGAQMRILFGSWPGYGHLLPLIRAAKLAGDDVVVSSGADMAELIGRLGVTAHRSGVTLAESYARLPHDTTISELPRDQQAGFAARHLFGAGAVDRARDVLLLIETWRPDLVIHEMMELGTPSAAVARGIPHITHGYGPMMPNRDRFLAMIGSTIGAAGFCDPIPETLATPYLDICPPCCARKSTGCRHPLPSWTRYARTAGERGSPASPRRNGHAASG